MIEVLTREGKDRVEDQRFRHFYFVWRGELRAIVGSEKEEGNLGERRLNVVVCLEG